MNISALARNALLGLLCSTLTHAAPSTSGKTEGPRWYQVELFVFAQSDDNLNTELWDSQVTEPPPPENTLTLLPMTAKETTVDSSPHHQHNAYRALPSSELSLPVSSRRFSNRGYRPLYHAAWRQPVLDRQHAPSVSIFSQERLADGQPALSGTVKISISRFLHLDTQLYFRQTTPLGWTSMRPQASLAQPNTALPEPTQSASLASASPLSSQLQSQLLQPTAQVITFAINQRRRMRSDELHYIDHPMIGMLVRITPYHQAEPEPAPLLPTPVASHAVTSPANTTPATLTASTPSSPTDR